ncbi:MAG: hypothetical protein GWP10_09865 [Nitrospiraceae bacterium]|nr:hypothetical protein [Nitrospiraceae bacterium]
MAEQNIENITDLSQLSTNVKSEEGAWLTLEHPVTGDPLFGRIKLAGVDSKIYQKQARANQDRQLRKGFRSKFSSAELESSRIALLVAITLAWENIAENGQELEPTSENVRHVYTTYPWIREQVDEFAGDRANFIKS